MHAALGHLRDDAEEFMPTRSVLVLECLDEVFAAAGPGGGGEAAAGGLGARASEGTLRRWGRKGGSGRVSVGVGGGGARREGRGRGAEGATRDGRTPVGGGNGIDDAAGSTARHARR